MSQLKVVSPTSIPRPPKEGGVAENTVKVTLPANERVSSPWSERLVGSIEDMDRKHVDIANSVSARVTTLERGTDDVRVARIFSSPVILDVSAKSTIYFVYTAQGSVTITLPPFEQLPGKNFTFKKMDATNSLILRVGSGLVEGATTFSWTTQYDSRTLVSDGTTGWWIV